MVLISEGLVSVSVLVSDGQVSVLVSVSDFEAETPSLTDCDLKWHCRHVHEVIIHNFFFNVTSLVLQSWFDCVSCIKDQGKVSFHIQLITVWSAHVRKGGGNEITETL